MTTRRATCFSILLVVLIIAVYWPIREAGFLNFDDGQYVNNNPNVYHGLTVVGFAWAFTTFHAANWHPLTWLSHMLDCQIFGDNPAGHHWMNVGFHSANSLLLFFWLWRTTRAVERSAFVAAIFALHPLHVESVAWIAERKDVLSGFFFLLVLIAYGRYVGREGASQSKSAEQIRSRSNWVWYFVALVFFACGLMAKPMLVTVPFLLLLLDVWPFQRVSLSRELFQSRLLLKLALEKIPFALLAAGSAVLTFEAQKRGGAVAAFSIIPMSVRMLNAAESYVWYVRKTAWPTGLGAYYSYPADLTWQPAVAAGALIVVGTATVFWIARRAPYALVGWLWYLGMLVPVIGLIQVGAQTRADRYTYLPMIGILILATWGIGDLLSRWRLQRIPFAVAGCAMIVACAVSSRAQVHYWKNSIVLFTRALEVSPDRDFIAHHNLGHALSVEGKQEEAIPHFREALRIRPDYAVAQLNWGNALGVQGKVEEAIDHYRVAIRLNPKYEEAYYDLGKALVLTGDLAGGKSNLLAALGCKPDYSEAFTALGNLYLLEGDQAEGLRCLEQGVKTNPEIPEAHYFLGAAFVRQGRIKEGVGAFRTAIKLQPSFADALNDLAWILATADDNRIRNANEALSLSQRACESDHFANPMHLDTLAVALSQTGHFDEAIERTRQAIQIAQARQQPALVEKLRPRLSTYQAHRPYSSLP